MKNILITGCSKGGIGYDTAHFLKERGFRVLATCKKEKDCEILKNEGLESYIIDLNDSKSIKEGFLWALYKSNHKIDALFNNGAYGQPGAVEDLSRETLKEQFETNLFGTQELTNLAIKQMRKQGYGKIIYNSSVLGFISMKYRGAYNSSKYAIEGLCDTLRLELYETDIDIVLIEPGPIKSRFRENALAKFLKNIDMQSSPHKEIYQKTLKRLNSKEDTPFTLEARAVSEVILKILESKNPKPRYLITTPTKVFWYLKKILSVRTMDKILRSID